MNLLAFDTATPSTVVGVLDADGRVTEARDDPPAGSRGQHAARLLLLAEVAMDEAGLSWDELDRLAVGVGPGGFTGLRIGVATARALAQGRDLPVVPVSSLHALALGVAAGERRGTVAAVLDARRGEAFAAAWAGGEPVLAPAALTPDALVAALSSLQRPVRAVGDGAVRFKQELAQAGVSVAPDGSAVHRIGGAALCRLGAAGEPADRDRLLPDYRREPDAQPPQR